MLFHKIGRAPLMIILTFVLASTVLGAELQDAMQQAEKTMENEQVSIEQMEKTASALREAIKQNRDADQIGKAQLVLARLNLKTGNFHQAADVLELLRKNKPEHISKYDIDTYLVHALLGMGEYLRAIEITNLLLQDEEYNDDPRRPELIYATAYNQETVLQNTKDAVELYRILLQEHPDASVTPQAAFRAGYLLDHKLKDIKEALKTYLKAATTFPDYHGEPALNPGAHSGWKAGWRALNLAGVLHNNPATGRGLADYGFQETVGGELANAFPNKKAHIYTHLMESALLEYGRRKVRADRDGKKKNVENALKWARKALEADADNPDALRVLAKYSPKNQTNYVAQYIQNDKVGRFQVNQMASAIQSLPAIQKAIQARPDNIALLQQGVMLALDSQKMQLAAEYATTLSETAALTENEHEMLGAAVLKYATTAHNLDMLLQIANTPRYPWNDREKASRAAIDLLAQNGDTGRLQQQVRLYLNNHASMFASKDRESYEKVAGMWNKVSSAFDNREEAFKALKRMNTEKLFRSGVALREMLRWELGRLAYNMDKRNDAAQYFQRHDKNDDLSADCWIHYYEVAQENDDVLTQLKLASDVGVGLSTQRWQYAKQNFVNNGLKNQLGNILDEANLTEDKMVLAKLLIKEIKGNDPGSLRKEYNEFLSDHSTSSEAPWTLIHVAHMLRNVAGKRRLPAFGKWLVDWSDKINSGYWKSQVLTMAGKMYADAGSQPARPTINKWSAVGPFVADKNAMLDTPLEAIKNPDVTATYTAAGTRGQEEEQHSWIDIQASPDGFVDLAPHFMQQDIVLACATTFIDSPEEQTVQLYAGLSGPAKIWFNDEDIITLKEPLTPYEPDAYMKEVTLKKGQNRVLIKSLQKTNDLRWGMSIRLSGLHEDIEITTTPNGDVAQTIPASPSAERNMVKAFRQAAQTAHSKRKTALKLNIYDTFMKWGRTTEARGAYRHLRDHIGARAQKELAMSYKDWDKNGGDYTTRDGFLREMGIYLRQFSPGDRYQLLNNYIPYADIRTEQAFTLTNNYIRQHPGDWPLILALWQQAGDSDVAQRNGEKQAFEFAQEYKQSPWIIDMAVEQFETTDPELLKLRYEATGLARHKLQWVDSWYDRAGEGVLKKVKSLQEKRKEYVEKADEREKTAAEARKEAEQLRREAEAFEKKARKAKEQN